MSTSHDDTSPEFTIEAARMIEAYYSKYGGKFDANALPAPKITSVLPYGRFRGAPRINMFADADLKSGDYCIDQDIAIVTGVSLKIHACINVSNLSFSAELSVCLPIVGCSNIANCNVGTVGQRCCFGYKGIFEGCLYISGSCLNFDLDIAGSNHTIELICV